MRWAAAVVMLVLLAAASYEAALAFGWLGIGQQPGEGHPLEGRVLAIALVADLAGAALAAASALRRTTSASAVSMIPVGAAAFMAARFYTFDPYYAPGLRRMSDGGFWPPSWVLTLVACSLLAGALTLARPRVGSGVGAMVVLVSAFTAFLMGVGH